MRDITIDELRRMNDREGLILQGCGGDPQEWIDGINEMLTDAGILRDGNRFSEVSRFEHDGLTNLAKELEQFDYVPKVRTPEEYGKYMIMDSGHYEYDENLAGYIDFAGYGRNRMEHESGFFGDGGYIAYHGTLSLDELMMEDPSEQNLGMKGME